MTHPDADAYDRGVAAGEIAARLAGHDQHFAAINGHLSTLAVEMHETRLAVQRLSDQADAAAKTVLATAKALREADEARRAQADQTWSPVQKVIAVIVTLATVVGVVVAFAALGR